MACTSVLRSVLTTDPWMIPLHQNRAIIYYSLSSRKTVGVSTSKTPSIRAPEFHHFGRPRPTHVNCFSSYNNNNNNEDDQDQDPPQEAVLKAISGLSTSSSLAFWVFELNLSGILIFNMIKCSHLVKWI